MKVIFFGTPQFAAEILQELVDQGIEIVAVVTRPDRPKGRSLTLHMPEVKVLAQALLPHVPIYQPERASAQEFISAIASFQADLFIVVAYGQILKQPLLDLPRLGAINIHASLLPYYRGAAPIQRCLMSGEKKSGVTIMEMVLEMDAGRILTQLEVDIPDEMTYGELESALCQLGKRALIQTLPACEQGTLAPTIQKHELATFAPKVELEDVRIDWTSSAYQIHNLVRGSNPHPGAWTTVQIKEASKRLKILKTKVVLGVPKAPPGSLLIYGKEGFIVSTGEEALSILQLQLEGKRVMSFQEFVLGHPQPIFESTSV